MSLFGKRTRRRLGRLLSPRMWGVAAWSLVAVVRLAGLRSRTPLDRVAGPWERERGCRPRPLREGDVSVPLLVAGQPLFFYPLFPKACLRRSLVLYRHLVRLGLDPEVVVAVRAAGGDLDGHAWVRLEGRILGDSPEITARYEPTLCLRRGRIGPPGPSVSPAGS